MEKIYFAALREGAAARADEVRRLILSELV